MFDIKLQLYEDSINTIIGTVDFFKDEHIMFKNSLKNIINFIGLNSSFTREFTVPATANNKQLFSFYDDIVKYNTEFNPHKSIPAVLVIEGVKNIVGTIEMRGTTNKNNDSASFILAFYGEIKSLKSKLSNSTLPNLDWAQFEMVLNTSNVKDTWTSNGDTLWPIQNFKNKWLWSEYEYDPEIYNEFKKGTAKNIHESRYAISLDELRPMYRLNSFIKNIFTNIGYTATFDKKILSTITDVFVQPMLKAGYLNDDENQNELYTEVMGSYTIPTSYTIIPFDTIIFDDHFNFDKTTHKYYFPYIGLFDVELQWELGPHSVDSWDVKIMVEKPTGDVALLTFNMVEPTGPLKFQVDSENIASMWIEVQTASTVIENRDWYLKVVTQYGTLVNSTIDPGKLMPNITAYKFIKGFVETFNLFIEEDFETKNIHFIDYESFYKKGNVRDWSNYVDTTKSSTRKLKIPESNTFKYKDSKDFANVVYENSAGGNFTYGELIFENDSDFSTGKTENESVFGIIPSTFLANVNSSFGFINPTDLLITQMVDNEGKGVKSDFLLFYYNGQYNVHDSYFLQKTMVPIGTEELNVLPIISPFSEYPQSIESNSLLYGFDNLIEPVKGITVKTIFQEYFSKYIQNKYDKNVRSFNIKGILPISEYIDFKMFDKIIISGTKYIVDEISYDLLNGNTTLKLELFNEILSSYKVSEISSNGVTVIIDDNSCDRDNVCYNPPDSYLRSLKLIKDGSSMVFVNNKVDLGTVNFNSGAGGGDGEGYHKYTIEIPAGTTPIIVGDVLAYYEKAWQKADSSKQERTAQGVVIKIEGNKYTLIRFGDIEKTAHGYELNHWYWLKADGTYTKDKPSRLAQLLFYVYDENILHFNIEQPVLARDEKNGWIHIGEHPDVGWTITPTDIRHYFELKITDPHFDIHNVRNFTVEPGTNRVKVDFPVRPDEDVFVNITIMLSLNLNSASTRTIEVAHGVDGSVTSMADWYNQTYSGNPRETLDQNIPMTYNWSGIVKNDHTISIFLRASTADQITGIAKSIQVTGIV